MQSGLGEAFKATVQIGGVSQNVMVPSCFRAKIETAAGELLLNPRLEFDQFDGNRNTVLIRLGSTTQIAEPAVRLTLELICEGAVLRVYPLLLDFPEMGNHPRAKWAAMDSRHRSAKVINAVFNIDSPAYPTALKISTGMDRDVVDRAAPLPPELQSAGAVKTVWIPLLIGVILILLAAIFGLIYLIKKAARPLHTAPAATTSKSTVVKQKKRSRQDAPIVDFDDGSRSITMPQLTPSNEAPPPKAPGGQLPANAFNLFTSREGQSIHIEEISDAMQEAQFWMSINDPGRAIEILEPQCVDENPTTPVMWLLLLELYRTAQDTEKFARLRQRFKQKFNTHILGMNESAQPHSVRFLCDFDHLTGKLAAFWNTNYILPFLESLLVDDREGERVGFELSVYQDILLLIAIAKELGQQTEPAVNALSAGSAQVH